jgi:hypothetical protein
LRSCLFFITALVLCAAPAAADIAYFSSRPAFTTHVQSNDCALSATETFEEATVQAGKTPFPDPLTSGVWNSPVFPLGLSAPGLTIQTNRRPGPFAPLDSPSANAQALFAVAAGAIGTNSIKVGEDLGILFGIQCSIDILFDADNIRAISLDLSRFQGFGTAGWNIGIFDENDVLIGNFLRAGPVAAEPAKNFFGVWSTLPIARINLFDLSLTPAPDAIDNIEIWVPAPGAAAHAAAFLALLASRRRTRPVRR